MITMRSFAEEKRAGTYELLLTSPVATWEIVAGKFLGTVAFITVMVGLTLIYGAILAVFGNPEIGILLAGYLGLYLLALTFVAIGMFASSLTENQIIAAVTGLVMMLLLFVVGWGADTAGETLGAVLRYLSVVEHSGELIRGVIDTQSLIYFGSMVVGWMFLTQRSVESIRWR
jgi:ABC-2 type transport system permease protein